MSKEVVAAIIGAGGAVVAAFVALLKRRENANSAGSIRSAGPVVQNSQDVTVATSGGIVIKGTSPAQLQEINANLQHIRKVLREALPAVPESQLAHVQEIDAMIHPNMWRALPVGTMTYPRQPQGQEQEFKQTILGKIFVRYLGYAAFLASKGNYRRSIINVSFSEESKTNELNVHFVTNDGALMHELKELFDRRDTKHNLDEIARVLDNWTFAKKFAFGGSASIEATLEPDQKLVSLRNAPLYEGEDTSNAAITANNLLNLDELAANSIQGSMSKALAFVGRIRLGQEIHENLVVHYDLDGQSIYKPHLLRLIYHILDKGSVAWDLFRISVSDPEKWDYMYHKT
jgi:hypothetical protein